MKIFVGNIISVVTIGGVKDHRIRNLFQDLREFMRARPKDYHRVEAYQKRHWDGWHYFITKDGEFATGFLPFILKYAQEDLGATVEVIDERKPETIPVFKKKFNPVVANVGNVQEGKFDYQAQFVKSLYKFIDTPQGKLYFPRGIYDAATNAGKSVIMSAVHNNIENAKTLVLIHRKDVFDELHTHFLLAHGDNYGYISGKVWKPGQITLAMVKTLSMRIKASRNAAKEIAQYNVLFVDECHAAGSGEHSRILRCAMNAGVRLFVSGTPLDGKDKVKKMNLIGLCGSILKTITNKELIERGVSQKPLVKIHKNDLGKKFLGYELEHYKVVMGSKQRMEDMKQIVRLSKGKSILICFEFYSHGEWIYKQLTKAFPDIAIDWVHGKMRDRKKRLDKFRAGETQVMIGSTIMQLGLNIKHIRVLVIAFGGESVVRLNQFIGRGLRHDGIHDTFEIHDWHDVGKYTSEHSKRRLKVYRKEQYEVEFLYLAKKNGTPL